MAHNDSKLFITATCRHCNAHFDKLRQPYSHSASSPILTVYSDHSVSILKTTTFDCRVPSDSPMHLPGPTLFPIFLRPRPHSFDRSEHRRRAYVAIAQYCFRSMLMNSDRMTLSAQSPEEAHLSCHMPLGKRVGEPCDQAFGSPARSSLKVAARLACVLDVGTTPK